MFEAFDAKAERFVPLQAGQRYRVARDVTFHLADDGRHVVIQAEDSIRSFLTVYHGRHGCNCSAGLHQEVFSGDIAIVDRRPWEENPRLYKALCLIRWKEQPL